MSLLARVLLPAAPAGRLRASLKRGSAHGAAHQARPAVASTSSPSRGRRVEVGATSAASFLTSSRAMRRRLVCAGAAAATRRSSGVAASVGSHLPEEQHDVEVEDVEVEAEVEAMRVVEEEEEVAMKESSMCAELLVLSAVLTNALHDTAAYAYDGYAGIGVPDDEATPLQNAFGLLFTVFCGWYFLRVVKKRGNRAKEFRVANTLPVSRAHFIFISPSHTLPARTPGTSLSTTYFFRSFSISFLAPSYYYFLRRRRLHPKAHLQKTHAPSSSGTAERRARGARRRAAGQGEEALGEGLLHRRRHRLGDRLCAVRLRGDHLSEFRRAAGA